MARLFDNTQTEYLRVEQAVLAGTPLAAVLLFNVDDSSAARSLFFMGDKDVGDHFIEILARPNLNGRDIQLASVGGGASIALSTSGYTVDTWHHVCGIWASSTDIRVLLDAGSKGTDNTNVTPANLDRTTIGYRDSSTPELPMSGMIAEAAIYDLSALPGASNSDKADYFEANILPHLAAGERPSAYPTGLVAYWDLVSDDDDKIGEYDLTPINTPSWAQHPDILCSVPESASAAAVEAGSRIYTAEITESANATDETDSSRLHSATIIEPASATDTEDSLRILTAEITEAASADDEESAVGIFNSAITEAASATDEENGLRICSAEITEAAAATEIEDALILYAAEIVEVANAIEVQTGHIIYTEIPPFMHKDLIDPYASGAWLWLAEIAVPGQDTVRIARNTADIHYKEDDYDKFNLDIGGQTFSGDGSIPRLTLRTFQDASRQIENIINETEGALGGAIKLIRVNEKWLTSPVSALEADYDLLASQSDSEWCTFTLGIPNPLTQRFPLRDYSSSICPWAAPALYKGPECQLAVEHEDTTCTGTYEDCYGKGNAIHWGAELGLSPSITRLK